MPARSVGIVDALSGGTVLPEGEIAAEEEGCADAVGKELACDVDDEHADTSCADASSAATNTKERSLWPIAGPATIRLRR